MGLFSKPKKEKPVNGMIKYLGLESFWQSLSQEEKDALLRYYGAGVGFDGKNMLIDGHISSSSNTRFNFFSSMIGWTVKDKNYSLAEKLIRAGEVEPVNESNVVDAHFFYQETAECYYKQRDLRPDAIARTEAFCLNDLTILPNYLPKLRLSDGSFPRIVTIQRLVILYEKAGRIQEAVDLCNMAIHYGLTDNTKGGYPAKLEKLKKKM